MFHNFLGHIYRNIYSEGVHDTWEKGFRVMKQGRTPDRVHVVRPPQDDYRAESAGVPAPAPSGRGVELLRTLAAINDKLKRSEAERYELLAELREYRKSLIDLEDRAEKSEKAYLDLENKIKTRDTTDSDITQRQARFERALKETEAKLVQTVAGQALLDKRVADTEETSTALALRVETTIGEQARIDRQIDKISQDRTRTLRKVERMEEILTETQDVLKARALILLTDQSAAAQAAGLPQIPAWSDKAMDAENETAPWWRKSVRMQGVGMASMLVAALLFGWTVNQMQQPDMPKIAVLENGGLARVNLDENRWEAINDENSAPVIPDTIEAEPVSAESDAAIEEPVTSVQTPAAQQALNSSDEELMAALNDDPDALAAQLNEIAPEALADLETVEAEPAPVAPAPVNTPVIGYDPLKPFGAVALMQTPNVAASVKAEESDESIASRIAPDETLPAPMQDLQNQSFAGMPEAQHDLAAIYTAGRGGVTQNFDMAAQWFREAADGGIANAAYNLGVLYHQGLGVERDIDRAIYWYREAAKGGHPEAQYNLGIAYIEGIGTDYDAAIAAAFFESAANKGVIEAAYNLGLIHENALIGKAATQEDALMWYKIAADGGSTDAKAALQQLANHLQIGMEDITKMADRMKAIYKDKNGIVPGGTAKS